MRNTKSSHPRDKSSTEDEMMSLGLFTSSSSSSSSSNLSPLALPFTVERSNHNKPNLNPTLESQIWSNFHSSTATTHGLLADSIKTATVPYANSTIPNPNNAANTRNWSSIRTATVPYANSTIPNPNNAANTRNFHSSVKSRLEPLNSPTAGLNPCVIDESFYSFPKPSNTPGTHNWSSMSSNINSGLEAVNPPAGHLFGVNPNTQPLTWSFGDDDSVDGDAPLVPLNFDLFHDYGSSHVDNSQNLFGSKYSGPINGSRGKEDSALFGGVFGDRVVRENNIGPSVIGKSHGTSFSTTNHGFVSSGFSKEHSVTWNGQSSYIPFDTRSIMYNSSSDHILPSITKSPPPVVIKPPVTFSSFSAQGAVSTKSLEIIGTSLSNKNDVAVSSNLFKEKESRFPVGFEFKASSNFQVPDIKNSDDVKSTANSSENLDHHNPGEDSPCWKGASTHFSLSGSQEPESSQHPIKKLQKNSSEDNLLPEMIIGSFDRTMDQSMHESVENAVNRVTAESLDVNVVVKALSNLSELLLLHCSKDECGLKEQDYKALDHVIANLNICMSREIQQDPAQKYISPQIITSNVLPNAGHLSTLHQERNNDHFGKNIEELQNASLKNADRSKDYDIFQKIQRVLDENLECKEDLPPHTLLYKNLWLEAEAELCTLSFRSRFHRAKREMSKSKGSVPDASEVAFDIKNVSSSNFSPIAPKLIHEAAGSKTSNTHAHNPSFSNVDYHINDVDNSVMARFNILKLRGESNPLNMADKEPVDVEASVNEIQISGVAEKSNLQHHLGKAYKSDSHGNQKMQSLPAMRTEDVEHLVMARWNILKCRDFADAEVSSKESQSVDIAIRPQFQHQSGKDKEVPSSSACLMQNQFGFGSCTTSYNASADWEHVLKDEFS